MRVLLLLLALQAPSAFAVKNLIGLCERKLTIDPANELNLFANQVAFSGPLGVHWTPEMFDQVGWLISDEFLRKNITPDPTNFQHWLKRGDQVFILNEDGTVKISGYYGELQEPEFTDTSFSVVVAPNNPYLFKDPELTEVLSTKLETRQYFTKHARAVVVRTYPDEQLQELAGHFQPMYKAYETNKTRVERFVRVGRRRAVELAHYQVPAHGKAKVDSKVHGSQELDPLTAEVIEGPDFTVHKYSVAESEKISALNPGDYLMLIGADGLVTSEGMIGSKEFPLYSDKPKVMEEVANKIRASASAFAARSTVDLKK